MRTARQLVWRSGTGVLAAAALALAGCGSDEAPPASTDDTSTSEASSPSPATEAPTTSDDTATSESPTATVAPPAGDDDAGEGAGGPGEATDDGAEEPTGDGAEGGSDSDGDEDLGVDEVYGIALPAAPDTLLAALEPLGAPSNDTELDGCMFDAPDGGVLRVIEWGELRLSGMAASPEEVQITSWEVFGTDVPDDVDLPHDLEIGDERADVEEALPGAQLLEEMPHGGPGYVDGALRVLLDGQTGQVLTIDAHIDQVACD